jgi:hypothetical protein
VPFGSPGSAPVVAGSSDGASVLEPLVPLFAPYCGGVAYQSLLEPAVAQLLSGSWNGRRRIAEGRDHRFTLQWQGEPAPLEPLSCQLRFPAFPQVDYTFSLPAYQLVSWLMQRQGDELPLEFWRWLLMGEQPGTSEDPGA